MIDTVQKIIEFIKYLVTWWFFIEPWEKAVRVRTGRHTHLFSAGVHFRIPFIDSIYVHNTRRMLCSPSPQTLSSSDGTVFVVNMTVSYCIEDVLLLHTSVHDPEAIVCQRVNQMVAEYITQRVNADITPSGLQSFAEEKLDLSNIGLGSPELCVSNFASMTVFRLVQDNLLASVWKDGDYQLSTMRKR